VALVDGAAVLYVDRGGSSLQVLPAGDDPDALVDALRSLADLVRDGRVRELVIGKVDGEPVAGSRFKDALLGAGFVPGYRGYALRGAPAPSERTYPRPGPVRPIR
jgi:ATP-dependent Lhr-like helicase